MNKQFWPLSDAALLDAYLMSVELELDPEFIQLLEAELKCRGMTIPQIRKYDSN